METSLFIDANDQIFLFQAGSCQC